MNYNENFKQELAKLNEQQRKAVEAIDGPVMVVAGPGTGKTHILSARIGQILQKTDVFPHNILCLTYTDAGAFAMRERLLKFIGPDAHKVHIYTFHSFCNNVVQDHLDLFGLKDLEPISDLERMDIIRKLIDDLEDSHKLKSLKNDFYVYEKRLKNLFDTIKSENWAVKDIKQKITEYLENLPNKEGFVYKINRKPHKKGDVKLGKINEEKQKMEKLRLAVDLFPKYQTALQEAKRYDFSDMLLWVVKAFEENEFLLRSYQERYLYILVDEFQDTNGIQNRVLKLLTDYWDKPNVFVVGDDDQSIFEFQGARVKNIREFYNQYEDDIELVVLDKNYRSSQPILDTAKMLIEQNELRLVNQIGEPNTGKLKIEKNLEAANPKVAKLRTKPQIIAYHNSIHETVDIATQIQKLNDKKVPLNEIAVIYRQHKQADNLIKILEQKGIPYETKRRVNILDLTFTQNVLAILKYFRREFEKPYSAEMQLFELLHFDFINISPQDLSKMTVFMANDRNKKIKNKEYNLILNWRDFIGQTERLKLMKIESADRLANLQNMLVTLIRDQHNLPLPTIFERIMNRSGLLKFVAESSDKVWLMQVISTLFNFVQRESAKNPKLTVKQLLNTIGLMEKNSIPIFLQKTFFAEEGVNLLTAHSSKGLEFEYVFMLDCVSDSWQPKRTGNRGFTLPDTLTLTGSENEMEAARRLFYVGMTRAKSFLQISYGKQKADGKSQEKTQFIDEILAKNLSVEERNLENNAIFDTQLLLLTESNKPSIAPLSKAAAAALLEGFVMSATALCRYLECPLTFYYESVLKVPYTSSEAASYGTAVHYALRRMAEKIHNFQFPEIPNFIAVFRDFEGELDRQKTNLTPEQYQRRLALGKQDLPIYYKNRLEYFIGNKLIEAELDVRNVEIQGVPVKGSIDKIEKIELNYVRIIDYKTGKYRPQKTEPPSEKHPLGGDYWRQVVFYKLLLENYHRRDFIVSEGKIDYVEPDIKTGKNQFVNIDFHPNHLRTVTQQITESYAKIMNHEFYEGCGKPHCHWCNFTVKHELRNRYVGELKAELDE
jgi:DNA helicase-2/ATP-dependent DNA helicase PcrA